MSFGEGLGTLVVGAACVAFAPVIAPMIATEVVVVTAIEGTIAVTGTVLSTKGATEIMNQ